MPNPLYELYTNTYRGESLLDESNFTQNVKNNKVFVNNFKKNLQKSGMTPEAIGTYFNSFQPITSEPSKGEFVNSAQQPEIPLSERTQSIDPNSEVLGTQTPEQVIDPFKDQSLPTETKIDSQQTPEISSFDSQNFYAEDLIKLADHVGVTQKYPAELIRANATNPKFMDKVVKELEGYSYAKEQLPSLKKEEKYATRSLFKQYYGVDPAQTDLKEPDVNKLVKEGQGVENAVKNRFKDGVLKTFDEKVEGYKVLATQYNLINKDPKEARRYFNEVIEPDKRIDPMYKLVLLREMGSSEPLTISERSGVPSSSLESLYEKQDKIAWKKERLNLNNKEYNDALLSYKEKVKIARDLTYFELKKSKDEYSTNLKNDQSLFQSMPGLGGNTSSSGYFPQTKENLEKDFNISSTEDLLKSLDKLIAQTETDAVFVDTKQTELKAGRFTLGVADAHLPLYDAKISLAMLNILSKQDKGEDLRPDEENMLKTYAVLTDAGQNLDRTFSFSIGQGVPNNILFMASLAASSGIMGGVEKAVEGVSKKLLLQQAQGRIAGSIGKKLATNLAGWAPQLLGNIAGNVAITPLQPMFVDLYTKNLLGTVDLKGELDPTNLQVDTSRKDRMSGFHAVTNAFRQTLVENLSESSGFILDKGINKILKNPLARKIMGTKNDFALAKAARVNGMVSEVLEEYVATAMNAPFETWQTTKDQLTMRSFAEIVVGTAIFTVPFGGFSAYQLHNRKKEINTAGEKLASTIGNEKFVELQTILNLPTLEQRKIALEEFSKQNKISGDQYLSLIKYGALKTVFDVQEGFLKEKEVPTMLSDKQRDIRKIIRSERTSTLETMAQKLAPDEFKAISDARDAGIADATKDNATVQNEYKLALGTLLRSDKLVSETNKINQQFAKQIHDNTHAPENKLSATYSVQSEFDTAISKVRKTSRAEAAESTKGKDINDIFKMTQEVQGRVSSFENRDTRIAEIDKELETAKTTKKNRLLRERTNLLSMSQEDYIKDTHKLEYFNERKQSLLNIQSVEDSRNIRKRFDDEMVYTDSEGNKKRLDRSPDLAEFNIIHDQVMASEAELRRMDAELSTPMPDKFRGKNEGLIWQEQRTADRTRYAKLLAETNKLKSEAETKFTEIHGPVNKGQQIAKTSTEDLKPGQKVILEDAISGAAMNAEILIEGIEQSSGMRYAIVQFQNKDGKKYQLTYVPDENSDYRLYESKDHESRENPKDTNDYYAGNPNDRVFKQPSMLERWNKSRKTKDVYLFTTESAAANKRSEFVQEWGANMVSDVWQNPTTGQFGFRLKNATVETPEQHATRIEQEELHAQKMGVIDYMQEMQDFYGHMSENELKAQLFAEENGDAQYRSYDQWLVEKKALLERAQVLSHESRDGAEDLTLSEMELIKRQAQVTKATNHLVSMTRTPIVFVSEDIERKKSGGKERKGWQQGNVYVVNLERATLDTPIHEYAHPIFDAIETENRPLFDKLYSELESTEEGRQIIDFVKKEYPDRSDQYQKKEALVTAAGKAGMLASKYDLNPFAKAIYKIKTVINNWIAKTFRHKGITIDTTLGELAEMIIKGQIKQGDISLVKSTEQHESQNGFQQSIISAVKEGQPFWILYQSKPKDGIQEPAKWRHVVKADMAYGTTGIVVTEGTGFSALDKGESSANIRIDDQRLQGFSLTEPATAETIPTETPTVEQPIVEPTIVEPTIIEQPKLYVSPTNKSNEAWKKIMLVAGQKYNQLINDATSELSKSEKIREATKAALIAYSETEYYKTLITSDERKIDNQILSDLIQKILRKQKSIIDEAGLQSMVEAIDGVASTTEDRMKQFESGFTPILNSLATTLGMSSVKLKIEFLDMFKKENIVSTKKDFLKIVDTYSSELQKRIAKVLIESPMVDFDKYVSMANFFGSIHIEDQYGIRITDGIAQIYNQVTSISEKNLRADFMTYNARMSDPKNVTKIQTAIDVYQQWSRDEYKRTSKIPGDIPLTQDSLTEFVKVMTVVTGLEESVISEYLNNPKATEGLFTKENNVFVPVNGRTFNELVGTVIYLKDGRVINSPAMISALMTTIHRVNGAKSLQSIIKSHMLFAKGKSSNLDFIVESFTRNEQSGTEGLDVEGNRFQTFSLNHHLYQATLTLDKTIKDPFLSSYYKKTPMRLSKFDGIKNMDTDKSFSGTKIDQESLWFGMLMSYNVSGSEYQQFLGQFSDKTTVYTGNALKRVESSDYTKAKEINPAIDKDIKYIRQLIDRNYSQFGIAAHESERMDELAKNFVVSFALNLDAIGTVIHGSDFISSTGKQQYKGLDDLIKRSQVTISPGYNYMVNIEGGVADKIRYVIVNDYIMRDLHNIGIEQLDGENIASEAYMKAAQISSGSIFARSKDFPTFDAIKGAISYVNEFGERILIKSLITNINTHANTFADVTIYEKLKNYMAIHNIDVLSFPSSAKKFGSHPTTSLFFNTMMPVSEVKNTEKTWNVTDLLNGLNLVGLQKQGEDQVTLYEKERDEEMQRGITFQDTKAYQKLKQNLLMRLSTSEMLKASIREELALANEEGKQYLFYDNQQYGNDVMTAFNEVLEEVFQKTEINESPYNKPKVLSIPRENFFIQQDLRHEKSPHAQDISTQMYTNFVTLPKYGEFIKNLTDANKMQYMFNKKFFNGFRDKEILREYLLLNINKTEDPDMYAMVDAWAINDPTFSNKVSTKLINILNRDILEVNISRQSSYEIADLTGKLKGLRKVMDSDGVERSLLPEIAVNIPGIRYGKEFKTREEAVNFMNDNKNTLVDLQNEDFSMQFWQLYKDGNKWIVPGEPIISSRTPAGNLNCHTVARARYKINSSSAITMLDINSRRMSGSDFDGDARYNWTLSKSKGVTLLDNTYQGKINKALMSAVKDYEDVQNFEKITTPIDTEAFDGIIKSLGIKESTNATFRSLKDQEKFRSRNMTGYNMKGIMSNLTAAFSYLNYFETPDIVKDKFNMVKVALDNLLNLSFDNAKDPKIEKLGLNESTAAMFVYELITDSSIDQATTAQEAKEAVAAVMNRLVDKYSDYSYLLQNKLVYQYLQFINDDKKSLFSKPDPVMTRMKETNIVGDKVSDEFEQFSNNYYLGKDLEAFGKIKSLRDGIPHKMSLFLIARANMDEFIQGKDQPRFYDGRHIPNLDGQKPALSAIYKTMELGENVFANMPGFKFINGLINIINNSYNAGRLSSYDKAKNITNTVSDEKDEINPIVSMRHLPYLTGLRNGRSFKETSKFIVSKLEEYQRIQEMTLEQQQVAGLTPTQTATNEFLETLVYFPKDGYYSIRIAPSTSNTKLSAEYTQRLKNSFDLLNKEMQDALAYNSLVAFGFNEGIKGGGYFGLISADTRIRMAAQATTDFNDFVFSTLQQRIVDAVTVYGETKGRNSVSSVKTELSAIPNINSILIDEQLNLEQLPNAPKAVVDTYLKQLLGETVENPIPIERIAAKQENLGLKSKDEFIVLLTKLQNSYKNVKHQLDNTNDFTEVALQDPEIFEYMFKHFKSVYPELKVFNDALEFVTFVESQTKNGDFNLSAIGAAFANAIYLSSNARQDTFFHEVAHIYWDALDAKDSTKMALRSLYGYKESMSKKEKDAIEEKIIEDIGKIGTDRTLLRFKGDRLQLFLSYLEQFWARVKSVFGLTAKSRNEAKMFFLNNVMADRIWNNGVSVLQTAIDAIVRHQISKTDYDSDIVNGRDISSSESWLRSQQLHANNLEQQLDNAYDKFNSERNNIPEKPIDRNPFNGDYVSVDSAGRVFLKDRDGDIVGHAINPNEITREKFQEAQLTTINRVRVLNQAIRAIVAGTTKSGMNNFKIDSDQFEFDEYFENPVEVYKEIKKIVDDLKVQFSQSGTTQIIEASLTPAFFDNVADHVAHVDAMGIDDQGNTTIVRIVPTFVSLNKDSVESSEYTEQTGAFTKGSPLNGLPTSKKEEIRLEMVQFTTALLNDPKHVGKVNQDKIKMITIPILLKRNEVGKVKQVERETQTVFDFTPEDKILGETILTHIRTEKALNKSFNLNNLFTALKVTVNESKAVRMTIDAIKSLQRLTGSLSTNLPTHNVLLSAKLGYGKILDRITKYGWDVNQFFFEPNVNIVQETRKFTSKIPLKPDGSGQLIYGSPGWGKKLASGLSSDFVDSSYLLERILFTDDSNARLLTAKSPVIDTLDEYSRYHELVDELEDGTSKKLTWATLISDYHNEYWTKELFAYKASLLIDQLRKVAIKELIATGYYDNLKTINPNDIIAIRQALVGKTGEVIDIINITTPYEELKTSIEQTLASGKHVLTSTLVNQEHTHLFDMQYDKAFRLVKDVNDTGANEDANSITGPLGMHERSTSGQYVTSLNYQNQKWIKRRFKTEIERFSGKSYMSYTEGFATDDLFKEPLSSQDGKITDMKVAFYIDHFKIKRSDFDKEFKNNSDLTVTEYVLNKARKYYTSTTMQFDAEGYVEGSAKKVYDTILSEEVQRLVGKNLPVHKALGLRNAPVTDVEYYDAVQLYNKNKTIAENIWKNFGSFGGFISMYDNSSHLTETEKGVNKRKLAQIFKQISGLDFINKEGLYEIVGNQIATNYVLEQVAKEASDEQRSFGYRMYTVLLNKMLTDPSFSWVDTERKWEWLGVDFTAIIQNMSDWIVNYKLDRSIDIKHTLGQTLALARMENDHNIKDDVAKVGSKLNELYAKMTDEDKENIIYSYGSKGPVKNSQGRLIYAGDKYKRSFGRYAYIPVNEAIEMVSQGTMSTHAYEYLNLVRSNMMKYDQAYANQQQRTNYAAPTFVPDFIAQKETGRLKNQVANHSEFVKAVLDSYKIDISNDRVFIDQLYKALDTSKEGGYLLTGLKNLDNDNLVIYEDLTLSQAKRMMFEPETVISEAVDNNVPIREVLANKIKDFETLRFEANKNAISRYVDTERAFKVHGSHSKGIILRTQKFNEATQMYLNSLILNYHTTAVTPFAFMAEDIQKQYAEGSPIMAKWSTKYIDANFFKFHQTGTDWANQFWRMSGLYLSLNSLGLNVTSGIGNFTAGQLQTFFLHRKGYANAIARIKYLPKVIALMHRNHIGMVLEDLDLKESAKTMEKVSKVGFIITEKIENINQGMGFLSQMTDEELAAYDKNGLLIPGKVPMSMFRIFQIESKIREINGDYGKNRALYRTNPFLMEWGRFKMGWWQAMIQTHLGPTYVDMWGEQHISIGEAWSNAFQKTAFTMSQRWFGLRSRDAMSKKAFANVMKNRSLDKMVSDTEQEAIKRVTENTKVTVPTKVFAVEIDGKTKFIAINEYDQLSLWGAMSYEMLSDLNGRDYSKMNNKEKEQIYRSIWEVTTAGFFVGSSALLLYTLSGIASGAGDPKNKGEVDLWLAFLDGYHHFGFWNIFNPLKAKPIIPLDPLKQYSSLNKSEWAWKYTLEMFNNYSTRTIADIMIPYDPTAWGKIGDVGNIPMIKNGMDLFNFIKQFGDINETFDYISEKQGFTDQTNKLMFYGRKLLPAKGLIRFGYQYNFMDKAHLEESQVSMLAKRSYADKYKMKYGSKNTTPDFSDPKVQRELAGRIKEMSALYFSNQERGKHKGTSKINEINSIGGENIKKGLKDAEINIDAIKATRAKYKKR